jgi:hypothetical protein
MFKDISELIKRISSHSSTPPASSSLLGNSMSYTSFFILFLGPSPGHPDGISMIY